MVTINGLSLETRSIEGAPDRPVLVLLHEGLGSAGLWRDFPDLLNQKTGCSTLAYSRAGYGRSSPIPLPRPLSYMHDEAADVLPHIIERLGGRPHVLVGHSDGASIAIIYAGGKPVSGLSGLVLMAPHVFVEDLSITGIEAARQAWDEGGLRDRLMKHHGTNVDSAFMGWNDSWLNPDFRSWNITGFLPRLSVPSLAIQGVNDDYGTLAQIDTIADMSASRVDRLVLDACGHAPQKDQTAAVGQAIATFLTEL